MAFKTLFTAMTSFEPDAPALTHAAALAKDLDAHLDVMCLGLDRSRSNYYEVGANAFLVQSALKEAHEKAETVRHDVDARLAQAAVRWSSVSVVAGPADATRPMAQAARFADLCVSSTPYRADSTPDDVLLLETMLFDAACPTLVVPTATHVTAPNRIVIAWNESAEALRAVRAALPFLQAAKDVHIAIIDPPTHAADRSDPGGALAVMLARHGVICSIQIMSRNGGKVSTRLQRHVTEVGGQMLVMGGYGHSRFREAVLGGATRDMLENAQVPVLMAH